MHRSHRPKFVLEALRRRCITFIKAPEGCLLRGSLEENAEAGYSFASIYESGIHLGLFKEEEVRPLVLFIAKQSPAFRSLDVLRSFKYAVHETNHLPMIEREAFLKQFQHAFQNPETAKKLKPEERIMALKHAMIVRSTESFREEPLLALKNFLIHESLQHLRLLSQHEIGELFLIMSRLGKTCPALTSEAIVSILKATHGNKEVSGPVVAALARCGRIMTLPSEADEAVEFAFKCAKDASCGAQHQVTILRALLVLFTDNPSRFKRDTFDELLSVIKEDGLLNLEGPNLAMMFSVLARTGQTDDPLVDNLLESVLPQLHAASSLTLSSIVRNIASLKMHLPSRLAEAANRRILGFIGTEPLDSIISCLTGTSKCANTTAKSRKILMECFTKIFDTTEGNLSVEEYAKITRSMAETFGIKRRRSAKDTDPGVLVSEMDLSTLETIIMHMSALQKVPGTEWAAVEVMRNLAELGVDYEEMKSLARLVIAEKRLEPSVLRRFILSLEMCNCRDVLLIRAVAESARKSNDEELKRLANKVIADIEASC